MNGAEPEPPAPETPPTEPEASRSRRLPGSAVLGGLISLIGLGWLLSSTGVLELTVASTIAVLLIAAGLAILATPEAPHGLLITVGIVLALAGATATVVDGDPLRGGIGDRVEEPLAIADVEGTYRLGIGQLTLDLTAPSFAACATTRIEASVGIGQLVVVVPDGATIDVRGEVGIGNLELLGRQRGGVSVDLHMHAAGAPGAPVLEFDLAAGIGDVTVTRAW